MTQGYQAVPVAERERLTRYLEAVVAARRAPVHTAVAFNAVYFGYDLEGEGYGRSPLRLDDFPVVTLGERTPALPVGAMMRVFTESEPFYAEIVYKEGAHQAVSDLGDVPAWVSGAPVGAEGPGRPGQDPAPRRRELLVPDPHAFGPALSPSPAQLQRLRTRRRWINQDGHVVVEARYPSREAAAVNGLSAYADHLLTRAREQLLSPCVPVSLVGLVGSTREDALRSGLLGLLETVRGALASSDSLRMWRAYAMTRQALAAGWRQEGPLGGDDMRTLASAVERAATPARRRHGLSTPTSVYTAVGPRLRSIPGAQELLKGVDYAVAVCRANLTLADTIRGDSDGGLFQNGTRVVLDDDFEGGGVWASHFPGGADTSQGPLVPAGKGWVSTTGVPSGPGPEPFDSPLQDDEELGQAVLLRSAPEEVVWRLPLRLRHLVDGCMPLISTVADELRLGSGRQAAIRLELDRSDGALGEDEIGQDVVAELTGTSPRLTGLVWPPHYFPGLVLQICWPRDGRVLRVGTIPLDDPVQVGDRSIGHCYDPCVLTREDAPGSDRGGDTAVGLSSSLLVMRTVRRCGLLTVDGHALLDRSVLPFAAYGRWPTLVQSRALEAAVVELLAHHVLEPALGSYDVVGQPQFPARPGERVIPLLAYRPARIRVRKPWGDAEASAEERMRLQYVPGHLRRLLPGSLPSETQRIAFREHCRLLGKADGWELPVGYTFVTQYTRGH